MRQIKFGLVAIWVMLAGNAPQAIAQSAQRLTLNEAIQLSLKNSKQLKLSHAKIDEAVANTRDMWNNHLPDVKVSGAYMRLNNPDVTLKIKVGTPSGGEQSAGKPITVNEAAYGIANVSLPLFSG